MKCIVCGKELRGHQRKYCSKACGYNGFLLGKSAHFIDHSKSVEKLYKRFGKSFHIRRCYRGNGIGFYIRVFVSACVSLGYSDRSIAQGIGKERSDICRHRHHITEYESQIAQEFLNNKDYVYGSKYNGFTYRSEK